MLKIRFFRMGKKHQPYFKIVVTDKSNPPQGGNFKEEVGRYNPRTKEVNLKPERINHWLEEGAQPTGRVHNLLVKEEVVEGQKKTVHSVEAQKEQEEAKEEQEEEVEDKSTAEEQEEKEE